MNCEGKIVVAGNYNNMMKDNNGCFFAEETNSVEIYDNMADEWTRMSSMVKRRSYNSLVSVKS